MIATFTFSLNAIYSKRNCITYAIFKITVIKTNKLLLYDWLMCLHYDSLMNLHYDSLMNLRYDWLMCLRYDLLTYLRLRSILTGVTEFRDFHYFKFLHYLNQPKMSALLSESRYFYLLKQGLL